MKTQIYKQTIFLFFYLLFVININAQSEFVKDDFDKLSLSAQLNKSDYIPLEPILLKLKITNASGEDLKLNTGPDFKRILVEIKFNGKTSNFSSPFLIRPGRALLGGVFEKGKTLERSVLLDSYLDEMFPEYGKYQVSIVMTNGRDDDQEASFKSNAFEINIKKPIGVDKEAIDFLRENQDKSLFWWKEKNEQVSLSSTGKTLVERFADKYSASAFGQYAILNLGRHYFNRGEIEKAKLKLEKIKSSSNIFVADQASEILTEISKKQ